MRCVGHKTCVVAKKNNSYKIAVGRFEGSLCKDIGLHGRMLSSGSEHEKGTDTWIGFKWLKASGKFTVTKSPVPFNTKNIIE